MSAQTEGFKRTLKGTVVSDKADMSIVVRVERRFKHPIYSKFVTKSKKYHAHDSENKAKSGDTVTIIESRPFSKLKKWELVNIN
ncbi:MAG: small subunit ribosomal protein S17 [Bacteriovoracaceae bacterium]|jgi:small subunit ribosomal protein S17